MFDYINKYNNLSQELRQEMNSPDVRIALDDLEKKYNISLASVVIRVMVKELRVSDLRTFFVSEFGLARHEADALFHELKKKIFFRVAEYLGIKEEELSNEKFTSKEQTINKNLISSKTEEGFNEKGEFRDELGGKVYLVKKNNTLPIKDQSSSKSSTKTFRQNIVFTSKIKKEKIVNEKPGNIASFFYFSPEDEEEIKRLIKKIDIKEDNSESNEKKVSLVLEKLDINFPSDLTKNRLAQIILTYFKGIRNRIDTKIALEKDFYLGGLGIDSNLSGAILDIADSVANQFSQKEFKSTISGKITIPEDGLKNNKETAEFLSKKSLEELGLRDVDYDFSILKQNDPEKQKQVDTRLTEAKLKNSFVKKDVTSDEPINNLNTSKIKDIMPEVPLRSDNRIKSEFGGKVKMSDVRHVSIEFENRPTKIMTPMEELAHMDILSFRRMGFKNPLQAVKKIKDMIDLFKEESYEKRFKAIQAWKNSPINKMYLEMGEESIRRNEPIDVIIVEGRESGRQTLTLEEFEAITDLNRALRY